MLIQRLFWEWLQPATRELPELTESFYIVTCIHKNFSKSTELYSSVHFSRSVVADSLRPHELQHARPPCPSPTPGVHQTQVHRVGDAIQPSHPLSSPSPPAPNPSQHQSLFQWVNSSHEVDKVLEFQLQHHYFQRAPRADLLQNGLVGSPCSPRDSQESSPTPQFKTSILRRSAFFTVQLSHPYMTTENTIALTRWTLVGKVMSLLLNMLSSWW